MLETVIAQVTRLEDAASAESLGLDSVILGEQFYFFTVVLMWLIHAGFMSYETGIARKKNAMATAMKNILTIAVVTPTFYYFGWWVYKKKSARLPIGRTRGLQSAPARGAPCSDAFDRTSPTTSPDLLLAFLLFSGRPRRSCPAQHRAGELSTRPSPSSLGMWILDPPGRRPGAG